MHLATFASALLLLWGVGFQMLVNLGVLALLLLWFSQFIRGVFAAIRNTQSCLRCNLESRLQLLDISEAPLLQCHVHTQ